VEEHKLISGDSTLHDTGTYYYNQTGDCH